MVTARGDVKPRFGGGGGRIVVKLEGNVSAVIAAVEAGVSAAVSIGEVYAHKVIPRPSDELGKYLYSKGRDIPQTEEMEEQGSQKEKTKLLAEDTKTPPNQVKQNEKTKISDKKEERK